MPLFYADFQVRIRRTYFLLFLPVPPPLAHFTIFYNGLIGLGLYSDSIYGSLLSDC